MKELIPEILTIFKDTPKIEKSYLCHYELHYYSVLDEILIKHKLRKLFAKKPPEPVDDTDPVKSALECNGCGSIDCEYCKHN